METVFGFDVGTGSLGIAVRRDQEMLCTKSLLLPADAGNVETLRTARRQYRTRLAHAAREAYWCKICREAGIEVLHSRIPGNPALHLAADSGDERLEREFAAPGDNTVYTSCLLRIKLLQGEKLEGWQIFKAVRSAFQRRGFDRNVPWKNRASSMREDEDVGKTVQAVMDYESQLSNYVHGKAEYMYPCYFDAYKMGLWDPDTNEIRVRPQAPSDRARGYNPPRELVIAELKKLLDNVAKQFPKLAGRTDEILFGPGREQYASYFAEKRKALHLREGSAGDWNALIGQKIPRFDNRQPGNCALIPRLHVCQANDMAVIESTFLLKLKNLRFSAANGREISFSADNIRMILDMVRAKAEQKRKALKAAGEKDKKEITAQIASIYKITKTDLKKCARSMELETLPGNDELEAPKISGRARFSRPAAKVIRDLILSGKSPHDFYRELLADPPSELAGENPAEDLKFLKFMPEAWEQLCIPDMGIAKIQSGVPDADAAVKFLIAEQRSPLIRLRLQLFDDQLKKLLADPAIGQPDQIVIEFIREDFASPEDKKKMELQQKHRKEENRKIREEAEKLGVYTETDLLKMKLLKEQGAICPYTGEDLSLFALDLLEIDHIVPRHGGKNGSDGFTNKVVTKRATNEDKGARTPYEYLHGSGKWTAYSRRVTGMKLSKRKQRLLLSPEAEKLDQKYSDLCSTAWLARIFRDIAMLRCHWRDGAAGENRHIIVVNGSVTAALRRRYRIDSLLAPGCTDGDSIEKKNRADKRHHALDAMVLTFVSFWMRNPVMRDKLILPEGITRYYFARYIEEVNPENILFPKAEMELTVYGKRLLDGKAVMTKREPILSLGLKNNKFNADTFKTNLQKVLDSRLKDFLTRHFDAAPVCDTASWTAWCQALYNPDTKMPVRKVRIYKGEPDEYKDFSKDQGVFGGQYRKGNPHRGYFIYVDAKGKTRSLLVYAHASVYQMRAMLRDQGVQIVGFFQCDCNVELKVEAVSRKKRVAPGIYTLNGLDHGRTLKLTKNGNKYQFELSAIPDILNNFKRC